MLADLSLEAIADSLRLRNLSPPGLARWAGTDRLSALAPLVTRLRARDVVPASAMLALFVAGARLDPDLVTSELLDRLLRAQLVELVDDRVSARVALLPIGRALIVADRLDAPEHRELACWPDDSSYHLALALPPGGHERWLDLGCGSGFAQLWRPELAGIRAGADRNPRALDHARLGAALSAIDIQLYEADLGDGVPDAWRGACDLVSCNAPIPGGNAELRPMWQTGDDSLIARLFEHAGALLAPRGIAVVHAALERLVAVLDTLPGERVVVAYTPPGVAQFGVAWWRPDGDPCALGARRELTADRPHLRHADRLAALREELTPL